MVFWAGAVEIWEKDSEAPLVSLFACPAQSKAIAKLY